MSKKTDYSFLNAGDDIVEVYITGQSGIRLQVKDERGVIAWRNDVLRDFVDRTKLHALLEESYALQLEDDERQRLEAERIRAESEKAQAEQQAQLEAEAARLEQESADRAARIDEEIARRVKEEVAKALGGKK